MTTLDVFPNKDEEALFDSSGVVWCSFVVEPHSRHVELQFGVSAAGALVKDFSFRGLFSKRWVYTKKDGGSTLGGLCW